MVRSQTILLAGNHCSLLLAIPDILAPGSLAMLFKQESQGLTNSNLLLITPQEEAQEKEHDMRVRPAQQEKMKTRTKQPTKREQSPTVRPARKVETKGSPAVVVAKATPSEAPQEETVQVPPAAPSLLVP